MNAPATLSTPNPSPTSSTLSAEPPRKHKIFSAQSYLRYQGDKFTSRFDANCYIHITRKLDSHDIARGRSEAPDDANLLPEDEETEEHSGDLAATLTSLPPGALVISIETDGLFTPSEQKEIAAHIPKAELLTIPSPDGHDGFLLEFEVMNRHILKHLQEKLPDIYAQPIENVEDHDFGIKKTSVFGEAEADVTRW